MTKETRKFVKVPRVKGQSRQPFKMTEEVFAAMLDTAIDNPDHPEMRDLEAKWITYPEPPMSSPEWHNNLFEISTTGGNGTVNTVTLTRMQAVAVAHAIFPQPKLPQRLFDPTSQPPEETEFWRKAEEGAK